MSLRHWTLDPGTRSADIRSGRRAGTQRCSALATRPRRRRPRRRGKRRVWSDPTVRAVVATQRCLRQVNRLIFFSWLAVDTTAPESILSFESLPPPPASVASASRSRPSREDEDDAKPYVPDLSKVRQKKVEEGDSAACVASPRSALSPLTGTDSAVAYSQIEATEGN